MLIFQFKIEKLYLVKPQIKYKYIYIYKVYLIYGKTQLKS